MELAKFKIQCNSTLYWFYIGYTFLTSYISKNAIEQTGHQ